MIQSQWESLVVFDGRQLGGGVAAAVQTGKSDQHSPLSIQGEQEENEQTLVKIQIVYWILFMFFRYLVWSYVVLNCLFQSNHGNQHM